MAFETYRKLKKLAFKSGSFEEFILQAAKWPRRYGVPSWTKANYAWFYEQVRGGKKYVNLFGATA